MIIALALTQGVMLAHDTTNTSVVSQANEVVSNLKPSIEDVIISYGSELIETTKSVTMSGVELVKTEVPIVIKQYLVFESVKVGSLILIGILLIAGTKKIMNVITTVDKPLFEGKRGYYQYVELSNGRFVRRDVDNDNSKSIEETLRVALPIITLFAGTLFISLNIFTWIKVTFFPKLYLMEMAIDMIKHM